MLTPGGRRPGPVHRRAMRALATREGTDAMELRVLEYFLALTREGSVSAAAEALHISQPTLSRQLMELERELGSTLFERGRHGVTLTEEGMLLRRRASEIVDLARITETEIMMSRGVVAGEIRIGCAETRAMTF